jgi:hypothetical protein
MSVSLLTACGQGEPQQPEQPAAEEVLEDDFPDLILPDHE